MRKIIATLILSAFALGAHAGEKTSDQLCQRYNTMHPKKIRAELEKRGALTAEEWKAVDEERIFVGMSATAVLCARGKPWVERKATEAGEFEVWRFAPAGKWESLTMSGGRVLEYRRSNTQGGA